ncbi:Aste57867_9383 [Aphanomyces stellatus]|uniref:Aste57867_9383 protein n=1 Tax=Aphanomyces stellatus TaxID=120398 RepID=A0A485KN22_9STRA|nr:hypothetical protein As57867_009347 [Aphanomyces stellatus]VFT86264.1 Aste57867_9383 [Aphanomyces stellatus]
MAASWFSTKVNLSNVNLANVNLSNIVSQGLEHVNKLKDDVEKQFDEAVSGKGAAGRAPPTPMAATPLSFPLPTASDVSVPSLFHESESTPSTSTEPLAPPRAPVQEGDLERPQEETPNDDGIAESTLPAAEFPPSHQDDSAVHPNPTVTPPSSSAEPSDDDGDIPDTPTTQHSLSPSDSITDADSSPLDDIDADTAANAALLDIVKTLPPVAMEAVAVHDEDEISRDRELPSTALDRTREGECANAAPSSTSPGDEAVLPPPSPSSLEVAFLQKELTHVQAELRKANDILHDRESQLMASSAAIAKLHGEVELMRNRATDNSVVYQLQSALADKEQQLRNLLDEGEALSKKQAAFETRLRALRKEKTDVVDENTALAAALDTAQAKWETARMHLIKAEDDAKAHALLVKTLDTTEAQLHSTATALDAAKAALAATDATVARLVEENAALRAATAAVAFEDREVLEATIHDLQISLATTQADAARAEDAARMELQATTRRWQDAVTRMDRMTHSASDATQPLLRQIQSLQDEQRAVEVERRRAEAEMQKRLDDAETHAAEWHAKVTDERAAADAARRQAVELEAKLKQVEAEGARGVASAAALQNQLDAETQRRAAVETQLHEAVEAKRHVAALLATNQEQTKALVAQKDRWIHEVNDLRWQLQEASQAKPVAVAAAAPIVVERRPSLGETTTAPTRPLGDPADAMTMVEWHQLQQKVRLRESEATLLKAQVQALEDARKGTNDQIVWLTTRNAVLETTAAEVESVKASLQAMEVKQHVLLELLGEKEEQVEELESEFREFKQMYQSQIDTLTRR